MMYTNRSLLKKSFFVLLLVSPLLHGSCPTTTPWGAPVKLSTSGNITSNIFSAATSAGFMAVWADVSNNANYSFSSDGITWQSGLVTAAEGDVAPASDVFVAGNNTGFIVTWIDSSNNGWSSFSSDNGGSWSTAIPVNPNSLSLDSSSDVYVAGGSSGFVATMIGDDENAYVSFSTGTAAWSAPVQVTTDGSVLDENQGSQTGRGFVYAVVAGNSCMLTWIIQTLGTNSAFFSSINPFSSTTVYPLVSVGFFESVPVTAQLNGYFLTAARSNTGDAGTTLFSAATTPSNWATFSIFLPSPPNPGAGPWIASNQSGFMSTWVLNDGNPGDPGSPIWTFSSNNGFNWTPLCSILSTESTTIGAPVALSANFQGFVATWLDSNDSNAYASFYVTPSSNTLFVQLLEKKYGSLL